MIFHADLMTSTSLKSHHGCTPGAMGMALCLVQEIACRKNKQTNKPKQKTQNIKLQNQKADRKKCNNNLTIEVYVDIDQRF